MFLIISLLASVGVVLGERFSARAVVITAGLIGGIGIALSSLMINITYLICTIGVCLGKETIEEHLYNLM